MSNLENRDLLSNPDAILFREGDAVRDYTMLFTIPLIFFKNEIEVNGYCGIGSAVLLKIQNRYFALTAGHCIEGITGKIATSVQAHEHRFELKYKNTNYVYVKNTSADYGYFEIDPVTAKSMEAYSKAFLSLNQIEVITKSDCAAKNDWVIIAGYPDAMIIGDPQNKAGVKPLFYATTLSGIGPAPSSCLPPIEENIQAVDVWVPRNCNIRLEPGHGEPTTVPSLSGVSGGACWIGNVRPDHAKWNISKVKLIGVHIASAPKGSSTQDVHARECLIGHHLAMISKNNSDIAEYIMSVHPSVSTFQA